MRHRKRKLSTSSTETVVNNTTSDGKAAKRKKEKQLTTVSKVVVDALCVASQKQMSVLYEVYKAMVREKVNVSLKGHLYPMLKVLRHAQRLRVNTYVTSLIVTQHMVQREDLIYIKRNFIIRILEKAQGSIIRKESALLWMQKTCQCKLSTSECIQQLIHYIVDLQNVQKQ